MQDSDGQTQVGIKVVSHDARQRYTQTHFPKMMVTESTPPTPECLLNGSPAGRERPRTSMTRSYAARCKIEACASKIPHKNCVRVSFLTRSFPSRAEKTQTSRFHAFSLTTTPAPWISMLVSPRNAMAYAKFAFFSPRQHLPQTEGNIEIGVDGVYGGRPMQDARVCVFFARDGLQHHTLRFLLKRLVASSAATQA